MQDYLFVLAAPLLVFVAIDWARYAWSDEAITQFVILFAFGHHLPGMMRAYGDRDLYARFRTRFVLAPIGLLVLCIASTTSDHSEVFVLAAIWGWWHYAMQTYGFARIYDAKAGSVARATRILDYALCLTWFATPILLYSTYTDLFTQLLTRVHGIGLPFLSELSVDGLQTTVAAIAACVTGAFLINASWQWSRGRGPTPQKLVLLITSFSLYWYSVTTVADIRVAYALFELSHDVQYLTIVWAFNAGRARQGANLSRFSRFLFQPRLGRVGLYLALILSYGMLERTSRSVFVGPTRAVWEGLFLASTLLHYYYDGFVWKLRDASIRAPLDLHGSVRDPVAEEAVQTSSISSEAEMARVLPSSALAGQATTRRR